MNQVTDIQPTTILTIGHGNRNINVFIDLLLSHQIQTVIDVRTLPYSRFHPQFRQINLKSILENTGVGYLFLGNELGGRPKNPDLYINGYVSYAAVKQTDLFKAGLHQVISLAKQNVKVTLMCSESDQNECHRKHLIADELIKEGISVIHINKVGGLEKHSITVAPSLFS